MCSQIKSKLKEKEKSKHINEIKILSDINDDIYQSYLISYLLYIFTYLERFYRILHTLSKLLRVATSLSVSRKTLTVPLARIAISWLTISMRGEGLSSTVKRRSSTLFFGSGKYRDVINGTEMYNVI